MTSLARCWAPLNDGPAPVHSAARSHSLLTSYEHGKIPTVWASVPALHSLHCLARRHPRAVATHARARAHRAGGMDTLRAWQAQQNLALHVPAFTIHTRCCACLACLRLTAAHIRVWPNASLT